MTFLFQHRIKITAGLRLNIGQKRGALFIEQTGGLGPFSTRPNRQQWIQAV
ncbi:hypothetical protein PH586_04125 [Pseudomonas sp. SA3-5]|uniref:DUF4236 domain-containing protein n=1 Tax=Pseudomonas aestuarii TaxID=3018340 RepID=A0ABT4XBK6_9PSED|nr:hypothetical protein [Pseudomonas aestuarii]MDA7085577.1 hypothetical protein [Pseudomonas aestuarii]